MAASYYNSTYGIPGGFIGAHPRGVDNDMNRRNTRLTARWYQPLNLVKQLKFNYSYAKYYHAEWESNGSLGMEFGVLMDHLDLKAHLDRRLWFDEGALGAWGEWRNYATGGLSFTPPTEERQLGFYLYERKSISRIHLKGALRLDAKTLRPDREYYSVVIGQVRRRSFSGLSWSLSVETPVKDEFWVGASCLRSWRAPTVEELYSRGPHLAAYSYEIGNPELDAERGLGFDLFVESRLAALNRRLSVFRDSFHGYIFPSFTGRLSARRNDLYEYNYQSRDALLTGAEASLDWEIKEAWSLYGNLSYVRGELMETSTPLAQMPPLNGKMGAQYRLGSWSFNLNAVGSARQDRLYVAEDPDARPEDPTSAWIRYDLSIQFKKPWKKSLHTVVFAIENITDAEYRRHLSRIKSIMPEAGRNVKCACKVYF